MIHAAPSKVSVDGCVDNCEDSANSGGCGCGSGGAGEGCGGCGTSLSNYPICYWAGRALLGFGLIITALSLCLFVFDDLKIHLGLIIGIFFSGIIVLFIPHGLIGGCGVMSMPCRIISFPAITIIDVVLLALSAAYAVFIVMKKSPAENS